MAADDPDSLHLLAALMDRAIAGSAAGPGRRAFEVGPFVATVHESDDSVWLSHALLRPGTEENDFDPDYVEALQARFADAGRVLRFEYFEPLHPWLGWWLDACGLKPHGSMPLMACGPADLRAAGVRSADARPPDAADPPGVEVRPLSADDPDAVVAQFLVTAKLCFGDPPAASLREVASARQDLRAGTVRSAYAVAAGVMAGVGSMNATTGELVGVGTLAPLRGRGVASAVGGRLLADHFAAGGPFAWLSAKGDAASAAYRRLGFRPVGTQVKYIEGTWDGRAGAGVPA